MRTDKHVRLPLALGMAILMVTGCSTGYGENGNSSPVPATGSESVTPQLGTPSSSVSEAHTAAPTRAGSSGATLTLFYVAVEDHGQSGPQIGCGDSLVATETAAEGLSNQIQASMMALLSEENEQLGQSGLRNALADSDLDYVSSRITGDTVNVSLSGTVVSGGSCDDPRIIAQLEYTAKAAAGAATAEITVNGLKLEELLSGK